MTKKILLMSVFMMLIFCGCKQGETREAVPLDTIIETSDISQSKDTDVAEEERANPEIGSVEEVENHTTTAEAPVIQEEQSSDDAEASQEVETDKPVIDSETESEPAEDSNTQEKEALKEIRAIWLTYLELQEMLGGNSEASYRASIAGVLDHMEEIGLNTLVYQVRPFGDALYPSELYPMSYIATGVEGEDPGFDPFGVAVEMAHERNINIEAWINPYRVRNKNSKVPLSEDNIAKTWLNDESRRVLETSDGIMVYNPSLEDVQERIVKGVEEILDNYPVDGIHFDDYFYPTTEESFDEIDYMSYLYNAMHLSLDDYRRRNVNNLIKKVYETVHERDNVIFGISPHGDIDVNYNQLYVDLPLWLSEEGYVDYICPQIYYGYDHSKLPYKTTLDRWSQMITNDVQLIVGIAAYKVGAEDKWAGDGKEEWITSEGILGNMIQDAQGVSNYRGYMLYRYNYLFNPEDSLTERMQLEREKIEALIEGNVEE